MIILRNTHLLSTPVRTWEWLRNRTRRNLPLTGIDSPFSMTCSYWGVGSWQCQVQNFWSWWTHWRWERSALPCGPCLTFTSARRLWNSYFTIADCVVYIVDTADVERLPESKKELSVRFTLSWATHNAEPTHDFFSLRLCCLVRNYKMCLSLFWVTRSTRVILVRRSSRAFSALPTPPAKESRPFKANDPSKCSCAVFFNAADMVMVSLLLGCSQTNSYAW